MNILDNKILAIDKELKKENLAPPQKEIIKKQFEVAIECKEKVESIMLGQEAVLTI